MADEPIATGTLAKTPLPHLLVYLDQKQLSGTLALWPDVIPENDKRQDRILLLKGRPVAGRLIEPAKTLREGLLKLFYRSEAPYAFYESNLLGSGDDRLNGRVDPLSLITESLRVTARDPVVDEVLGRVGAAKLRVQPKVELARFEFLPEERTIVELLMAEPSSIEALCSDSSLPRGRARRVLYLLLITKSVAPYEGHAAGPSAAPPYHSVPPAAAADSPSTQTMSAPPPPSPTPSMAPGSQSLPGSSKSPSARLDRLADMPHAPEGLSPELAERWQKVLTRTRLIENQNYFEMLSLDKKATTAEAKAEFFKHAKEWHPDRVPPELAPLRPYVEIIFGYLNEAHKVLGDEEQRIVYLRTVREGGGTPAAERMMAQILDSAIAYERVLVFARKHHYDEALDLLYKILTITKDEPDYHAMLGWLLMQKHPGTDAPLQKITESLDKAIELHPDHEKAQLYKAQLLKRLGRHPEALRHYKRVVSINPNNLDAAREVRVANMREENKDKTTVKGPGGLFSKLLGGNSDKPTPSHKPPSTRKK
jgi:curved DNA-binding protein CbpA